MSRVQTQRAWEVNSLLHGRKDSNEKFLAGKARGREILKKGKAAQEGGYSGVSFRVMLEAAILLYGEEEDPFLSGVVAELKEALKGGKVS